MSAKHTSKHIVRKKLVEVDRAFKPEHIAANYHLQFFGEHATSNHKLLGRHGMMNVEYVEDALGGAGGPEFLVTLPDGDQVTVICANVVKEYLEMYGEK